MLRKKATAIKYDKDRKAPHITAKGAGLIAEAIIAKAREHNIPIKEDPDLVEALSQLDIHQEIPEELYRVVAEILVEVYHINKKVAQ